MRDDILVWVDVETMNLEATAPTLELGFRVTDLDGGIVNQQSWLVWEDSYQEYWDTQAPEIVKTMHSQNKLFLDASSFGMPRSQVDEYAATWLSANNYEGNPMCGSSVHADRGWIGAQMPRVLNSFHYRNIDNSSIKELCRRLNPSVYAQLPPKQELHRVDPDLVDSVEEYKFYLDNFLWDGRY